MIESDDYGEPTTLDQSIPHVAAVITIAAILTLIVIRVTLERK